MIRDADILAALETLHRAGYGAWVVGGYVRDIIRGQAPHDADICTAALPQEVMAVFAGERIIPTGLKHGTVTILWRGQPLEITTLRRESGYADHRRPDAVEFVTDLSEDLARRDFTVNAMATDGEVLTDLYDGVGDISRGLIRCVGEPLRRFNEDALRIMRALRFAAVLDYTIHPDTAAAAFELRGSLAYVSRERVRDELSALLCGAAAGRVMAGYAAVLDAAVGVDGLFGEESIHRCVAASPALRLRLAALLYGRDDGEEILRGLRYSNADVCGAVDIMRGAEFAPPDNLPAARRYMAAYGHCWSEICALWRALGRDAAAAEALCRGVEARGDCITTAQLAINGGDLAQLGVTGPAVGAALRNALEAVMDGAVENDRTALLAWVKK